MISCAISCLPLRSSDQNVNPCHNILLSFKLLVVLLVTPVYAVSKCKTCDHSYHRLLQPDAGRPPLVSCPHSYALPAMRRWNEWTGTSVCTTRAWGRRNYQLLQGTAMERLSWNVIASAPTEVRTLFLPNTIKTSAPVPYARPPGLTTYITACSCDKFPIWWIVFTATSKHLHRSLNILFITRRSKPTNKNNDYKEL
jgi:hypothetical protein